MLKKIIEKAVRKEVAMKSLEGKASNIVVDMMKRERKEKEKAIGETLKLKEKLEASQRREESMHKEIDEDRKEIKELKEKISNLSKQYLNSHFGVKTYHEPFNWGEMKKQFEGNQPVILFDKPKPITHEEFYMKTNSDVNNLPFYTLEYSVDGNKEKLINLSLHDCEELYGQVIGSLEYFKISKQDEFIEEVNEYRAYGTGMDGSSLFYGSHTNIKDLVNDVVMNPYLKSTNELRFYKNGKKFSTMDMRSIYFTKIKDIRKELEEKEKEIDQND